MRAGTLSDPRVIALLEKYFVSAQVTLLSTPHLIRNSRDLELLRGYASVEAQKGVIMSDLMRATRRPDSFEDFVGGVREVFLTPAGELTKIVATLRSPAGGGHASLYRREDRVRPDPAVRKFFAAARATLERSTGTVPDDFAKLLDGTAVEVAAVAERRVPSPPLAPGHGRFRLSVRNDSCTPASSAMSRSR